MLISELGAQRDGLLSFCDALTDTQRTATVTDEGWNIQDFIGHLSFWEQQTLNHLRDTFKNGRPTPFPPDASDDDINGRAMTQRQEWSWERVRAEFENTRIALSERIDGLSESDLQFYVPSPWVQEARMITLEGMIREDVLEHGQEHFAEWMKWQNQMQNRA